MLSVSEHDGVFFAHDFMEADELFDADEGAGAIVDEHVGDIGGQHGERVLHGVLALLAADDELGRSGSVGGEGDGLGLVAHHDDIVVGDIAFEESGHAVGEDRAASEGGQDFIGDGALHAAAASGGE